MCGRPSHGLTPLIVIKKCAVFFDPLSRLAIRAESVLKRHVGPPNKSLRSDAVDHFLKGRLDFVIREVEEIPDPNGKADFKVEVGVLERAPDVDRKNDLVPVKEDAPGEAVSQVARDMDDIWLRGHGVHTRCGCGSALPCLYSHK